MRFEKNTIFHIYNQGNNRQQIFFNHENYLFFLRKMRDYVCPYGDFLCYCLMPNHFHWLVYVRETVLEVPLSSEEDGTRQGFLGSRISHRVASSDPVANPATQKSLAMSSNLSLQTKQRTLNQSIAILLRSYAQAINKQENRSGSLFRQNTKAKDGWEDPYLTPLHPDYGKVWQNWELYGHTCFHYIHDNPVEAGLVGASEDWEYSSASDFAGLRKGTLCNQELAKELLFLR
ncbi:MAG: hypothetical protein IT262_19075 [Saprospiraceae bacterium]|nr:hypothetical protein [Saprospiraceae bacterium]